MSGALVDGVVRVVAETEGVDPDRMPEFRRRVGREAFHHPAVCGPGVRTLPLDSGVAR